MLAHGLASVYKVVRELLASTRLTVTIIHIKCVYIYTYTRYDNTVADEARLY